MRLKELREGRGAPSFIFFPRYCQLDPWPSPASPPPLPHRRPHALGGIVLTQQIVHTHVSKYLLKLSLITKQAAMLTGWRAEVVFQSTGDGEGVGRGKADTKNKPAEWGWLSQGAERSCQAARACEAAGR